MELMVTHVLSVRLLRADAAPPKPPHLDSTYGALIIVSGFYIVATRQGVTAVSRDIYNLR